MIELNFAFCDIVKWQLKKNKVNLKQFEFDGYNITFVLPIPKSMSKKNKQEFLNTPHQKKPDIDNLIKSFFDAIYEEDSHIWKVSAIKIWGKEGKIILS